MDSVCLSVCPSSLQLFHWSPETKKGGLYGCRVKKSDFGAIFLPKKGPFMTQNVPVWTQMALKHFPLEYYVILCHAGPPWGFFRGPLGPCGPLKRPQGGPICHIIMYYAPEKCFRAIWGHAGTFWVMMGHFGSWRAIFGHKGPFWCCFGQFWGPLGHTS